MAEVVPRLVPLAEAKKRLGGMHPAFYGIVSLGRGRAARWDLKAIEARLDQLSGLTLDPPKGAGNDTPGSTVTSDIEHDELAALERKIEANATRRS